MNHLWPKSLLRRNVVLLSLAIGTTIAVAMALMVLAIVGPQLNRLIGVTAELVNAFSVSAREMDEKDRDRLLTEAIANPSLQIFPESQPPVGRHIEPNPLQAILIQRFINRLEDQEQIEWHVDQSRTLWMLLSLGDDRFWVGFRLDTSITPSEWLFAVMVVTVLMVAAVSYLTSRAISRPLTRLKSATDAFDLDSELDLQDFRGPDEIETLAKSFERMGYRLQRAEAIRSETLAAFSHDLRTPLARLQLALEMMDSEDELRESANRQIREINSLIVQFLDYARGTEEAEIAIFDLAFVLRDLAAQYEIGFAGPDEFELEGDQTGLRRAVVNLVENALKYGEAPISIGLEVTGGLVCISVKDSGRGFDPSQADDLLQSFRRGDAAQGIAGAGLGLAIVEQVASSHGGTVSFEQQSPAGFVAKLTIPRV